jgi:hypothetical protein
MWDVEISHLLVLIDRADRVVLAEEVPIPIRDIDGVHTAVRKRLDGRKGVLVRVLHLRVHRGRAAYGLLSGRLEAVVWVLPGIC